MHKKKDTLPIIYSPWIILIILLTGLYFSCANQGFPTGGPRDSIPPSLTRAIPPHESVNITEKKFQLIFNEFINVRQITQELIITPPIEEFDYSINKNTLTIEILDTLQDSTTYTLNFGDGITDITENNPVRNMVYAFSTGPFIDSMSMGGTVKNLLTNQNKEEVTVGLYPNNDTASMFTQKPLYFAKTNEKGKYFIQNVKQDNYKTYAFKDKNDNLLNESDSEPYAFKEILIELNPKKLEKDTAQSDTINRSSLKKNLNPEDTVRIDTTIYYPTKKENFSLFKLDARPLEILNARPSSHYFEISLNKPIKNYDLKPFNETINFTSFPEFQNAINLVNDSINFLHNFQENQKTIRIYNTFTKDSVRTLLKARDSLDQSLLDTFYIKFSKTTREKTQLKSQVNVAQENIQDFIKVEIKFNKPIKTFFYDSVSIAYDSIKILNINPEKDVTYNKRLDHFTLSKEINKKPFLEKYITKQFYLDSITAAKNLKNQNLYRDSLNNSSNLQQQTKYLKKIYSLQNKIKPVRLLDSLQIVNNKNLWQETIRNLRDTLSIPDSIQTLDTVKVDFNQPKKNISLNINKGAFLSIENDTSKKINKQFKFLNPENYGTVKGTINSDYTNYFIQILDQKYNLVKEKYIENPNDGKYSINFLKPGNYFLRVLVDENKNGKWDKGNILNNRLPEPVIFYKENLEIRANWERQEIDLTF